MSELSQTHKRFSQFKRILFSARLDSSAICWTHTDLPSFMDVPQSVSQLCTHSTNWTQRSDTHKYFCKHSDMTIITFITRKITANSQYKTEMLKMQQIHTIQWNPIQTKNLFCWHKPTWVHTFFWCAMAHQHKQIPKEEKESCKLQKHISLPNTQMMLEMLLGHTIIHNN